MSAPKVEAQILSPFQLSRGVTPRRLPRTPKHVAGFVHAITRGSTTNLHNALCQRFACRHDQVMYGQCENIGIKTSAILTWGCIPSSGMKLQKCFPLQSHDGKRHNGDVTWRIHQPVLCQCAPASRQIWRYRHHSRLCDWGRRLSKVSPGLGTCVSRWLLIMTIPTVHPRMLHIRPVYSALEHQPWLGKP